MDSSHISGKNGHTGPVAIALAPETQTLSPELQVPWERCKAANHDDRISRALFRVCLGASFREAAESEGYEDHAMLWRLARRYGLFRPTKDQLVAGNKRIAAAANEEIERRIAETPAGVSDRDLIVASGVAQDKIAKAEHWDRTPEDSDYAGSLREMAKQLGNQGGKITLELKVQPRPEPVDVTPES